MRGSTHAVIGANTVWIPLLAGLTVQPWLVAVGAFAALLPDLDASESKIKSLTVGGYVGKTKVGIRPFVPIAMVFSTIFGHRGALHSLLAVVIVAGASTFLIPYVGAAGLVVIILGYASHLAADAMTKSGIEFLWPLKMRFGLLPHFIRVKTGGILDTLLSLIGSGGVVVFLYQYIGTLKI